MEWLNNILTEVNFPLLSAFLIGILMAISPCPMATNITATAYISQNFVSTKKIFYSGILYALGRSFSYLAIGAILILGADIFEVSYFFNKYGEKIIGVLLLIIGLLMLDKVQDILPGGGNYFNRLAQKINLKGNYGSIILGVIFALAFCPYSASLYFGGVIPMVIKNDGSIMLLVLFSLATALPVILISWIIAFSMKSISSFYNSAKKVDVYFRRITSIIFIGMGIYYIIIVFF
ncbi:MAG: aromatic aminobenezylarsenical efflux permease ArsG family transporter [Hyphomicrobiales bacterium]